MTTTVSFLLSKTKNYKFTKALMLYRKKLIIDQLLTCLLQTQEFFFKQ